MATMPLYGKNPLKIFCETSRPMPFEICPNDDPRFDLDLLYSKVFDLDLLYSKVNFAP